MATTTTRSWKVGPELSSGRFGGPTIKGENGLTVAVVLGGGANGCKSEHVAAKIAAAPDLLAACKAVLACKMTGGTIGEADYTIPHGVRDAMWAAVRKAENH